MIAPTANGSVPRSGREAALFFIDHGCAPVPVPLGAQYPEGINGWERLRVDHDSLNDFFPAGREVGVGVLTGDASGGLADVDCDCVEAIRAARVLLPATGWKSGRQSHPDAHRWYRVVSGTLTEAAEKFIDPTAPKKKGDDDHAGLLIELRFTGSYTLAYSTQHFRKNEPVTFSFSGEPADVDAADLRSAVAAVAAAVLIARHWPASRRHDASLAVAGGLLRADWAAERVDRFVTAVCLAAGDEEPKDRARAVADTVAKLAAGKEATGWPTLVSLLGQHGAAIVAQVRAWLGIPFSGAPDHDAPWGEPVEVELPPPVPFPLNALPAPIRDFAAQTAAAMPCPPDLPAALALSAAAQAVGRAHAARIRSDWFEGTQLWVLAVQPPGRKKSPVLRAVLRPILQAQAKMVREYEQAMERFEAELAAYEAEMSAYKKACAAAVKAGGDRPEPPRKPKPPPRRQLFTSDTTREAYCELLLDNPRGVGLFRDELAGFALSLNQYRAGGRGDDRQFWLSLWSGEACPVNRKGRRMWLPHPHGCVAGLIQPDVLPKLQPEAGVEDGFVDRFLPCWPEPVKPRWTGLEVDPQTVAAYEQLFEKLLALPLYTDDFGEAKPAVLRMTPGAVRRFAAFVDELADEIDGDELPENLKGFWNKLQGYTARMSLVLHVCRMACGEADPSEPAVDEGSVGAAVKLARYFQAHARRVYLRLGSAAAVAGERDVQRVLDWIGRNRERWSARTPPQFTWREAFHDLKKSFWDRPEDLRKALKVLEDRGHIREVKPAAKGRGRRPKGVYEINPQTGSRNARNARIEVSRPDDVGNETDSGRSAHFGYHSETENQSQSGERSEADSNGERAAKSAPGYVLVTSAADLAMVATSVEESTLVGLDTETTGLDARADRVRLLSLCCDTTDGGTITYVLDLFALDPSPLWEVLSSRPVVGHNLLFDLQFLAPLGFEPGEVRDTMLMSQVLHAGDRSLKHTLAACCDRELGEVVAKGEQLSDWSNDLTADQLAYAAKDAELARRLHDALNPKLNAAGLTATVALEHGALPGVAWMASAGVAFDRPAWDALASEAEAEADRLTVELDRIAPACPQGEFFGSGWCWNSAVDVAEALTAAGCPVKSTDDDTLAAIDQPLAALLRDYRAAKKRTGTYGRKWLEHVAGDGRVYAQWRQCWTVAGRMSCSSPNLQNLPRDVRYRRCFMAPAGRVLVKADYSQIELRIAAKVAGERNMLDAYARGDDLHTLTARRLLGKDDVSKADRQLAKSVNFGLIYGMGARAFRVYARSNYGVELTEAQAAEYRRKFFDAYPGLRKWHAQAGRTQDHAVETRTVSGRRRLGVSRFTEKLNTPVQGTGADGLKAALALLWERRGECPGAVPVLAVHDEIVIECDTEKANSVAAWLKQAMLDGMAPLVTPLPVEIEVSVGSTWGG